MEISGSSAHILPSRGPDSLKSDSKDAKLPAETIGNVKSTKKSLKGAKNAHTATRTLDPVMILGLGENPNLVRVTCSTTELYRPSV
jgi:hypothetical protein